MAYTDDILTATKKSFQFKAKTWKTVLYDIGFYACVLIVILLINMLLLQQFQGVNESLDAGSLLDSENAKMVLSDLVGMLVTLIGTIFAGIVVLLIAYGFFKGLIWATLLEKGFDSNTFKRYTLLSSIILVIEFVIFGGLTALFKTNGVIISAGLVPLFTHLHWMISYRFMHIKRVRKSILTGASDGIMQLVPYIPAYVLIWLVMIIISRALTFLQLPNILYAIISALVIIIWVAWARYYFYALAELRLK